MKHLLHFIDLLLFVVLHFIVETSRLICTAYQIYGFYVKCNTGLKLVNLLKVNVSIIQKQVN